MTTTPYIFILLRKAASFVKSLRRYVPWAIQLFNVKQKRRGEIDFSA
jgi:hypothetical protein